MGVITTKTGLSLVSFPSRSYFFKVRFQGIIEDANFVIGSKRLQRDWFRTQYSFMKIRLLLGIVYGECYRDP